MSNVTTLEYALARHLTFAQARALSDVPQVAEVFCWREQTILAMIQAQQFSSFPELLAHCAMLGRALEADVLTYIAESWFAPLSEVKPSDNPEAIEALIGGAVSVTEQISTVARLGRDDQGRRYVGSPRFLDGTESLAAQQILRDQSPLDPARITLWLEGKNYVVTT